MSKPALIATMAAALILGNPASADTGNKCKMMHETRTGNTYVCGSNGRAKYAVEFWKVPGTKKTFPPVTRPPIDDEIRWFREQSKGK